MPRTLDHAPRVVGARVPPAPTAKVAHRAASVSVPMPEWFELLENVQGRRVSEGLLNDERIGSSAVAIADWAPFDRIVEFVLLAGHRRRRILIDLPTRLEVMPVRHGADRLTVRGWRTRMALVIPDGLQLG